MAASDIPGKRRVAEDEGLQRIPGVGQTLAAKFAKVGVTSLRQVAAWTEDDIDKIDFAMAQQGVAHLKAKIVDEEWPTQAALLMEPVEAVANASPPNPEPAVSAPKAVTNDPFAGLSRDELIARLLATEAKKEEAAGFLKRPKIGPQTRLRLNRHRKFSFILGGFNGAHFGQVVRGKTHYFDHADLEIPIGVDGEPVQGYEDWDVEEPHEVENAEDVNYSNWLEDKVKYPFAMIKQRIKQVYGKAMNTEQEARSFLHIVLHSNL